MGRAIASMANLSYSDCTTEAVKVPPDEDYFCFLCCFFLSFGKSNNHNICLGFMSLARKIALAGLTLVFLLILITYFTGGPVFAVAPLLLPFVMILVFGKFFRRN